MKAQWIFIRAVSRIPFTRSPLMVLILLIAATPHLQATEDFFRFPLNAETRPRFEEVCRAFAGNPVVSGVFTQTKTISRLNRSLVSEGNFIIASGTGMIWDTRKPFPSIMAIGRDFIIQSTPSGTRTRLDAVGNETFLRFSDTISAVFSGDSRKLIDNFEIYFNPDGSSWTLGLLPKEKAIQNFAVCITMAGDAVIRRITLYEQNGDLVTYELADHKFSGGLSPSEKALFTL
jgi:outer membrane lipoprotein-sorting protein